MKLEKNGAEEHGDPAANPLVYLQKVKINLVKNTVLVIPMEMEIQAILGTVINLL